MNQLIVHPIAPVVPVVKIGPVSPIIPVIPIAPVAPLRTEDKWLPYFRRQSLNGLLNRRDSSWD